MEILITHLTRMRGDRICVAGLTEDGQHVRPMPRTGHLVTGDAEVDFQLGNVVSLGNPQLAPMNGAPEDCWVDLDDCYAVRTAGAAEVHGRLSAVAVDSLTDAFGDLGVRGHDRWVVPGQAGQTLGVVRARAWRIVPQFLDGRQKAGFSYNDPGLPAVRLPLTDLRIFPTTHGDLDFEVLQQLMGGLGMRRPVLACVGLSRPFAAGGDEAVRWTMANTLWADRAEGVIRLEG